MSSPSSRGAVRRARIARQHRQVHDALTTQTVRRLVPFFRALSDDVMSHVTRADSPALYVDQIFDGRRWAPLFNSAILPQLRTSIDTGATFEREWIESATGEKTRQSILSATVDSIPFNSTHNEQSHRELLAIQHCHNSGEFLEDFSGNLTRQKGPGGSLNFLPDINVPMSAELQRETEKFLSSRSVGIWGKVSETTRKQLAATIQAGLKAGDNLEEMTSRIQTTLRHYTKNEAMRVARTETTGAMNFGGHAERMDLGIPGKEWISTIDSRNRGARPKSHYDHLTCAGQIQKAAEPFLISGEQLMYPGDSSLGATAGNIVHCRCGSVGAWPEGMLAGGGFKPGKGIGGGSGSASPAYQPALTPAQQQQQTALNQANLFRRNDPLVKGLIKIATNAMKKAHTETEEIRSKVVAIRDRITAAQKRYGTAAKSLSKLEAELQELRKYPGTAAQVKKLEKIRAQLEAEQTAADAEFIDASDDVQGKALNILKATKPTKITITPQGLPANSPQERAAKEAAKWLGQVADQEATGARNLYVTVERVKDRANSNGSLIRLSDTNNAATAAHELGHVLETLRDNGKIGKGFLLHRTEGYGLAKPMDAIEPLCKPHEVYWDDEFLKVFPGDKGRAAYTGRYYAGIHTEIISMGLELLYANPIQFALRDPEFFRFIVGILRGLLK